MTISFDRSVTKNFEQAIRREWLETNGLGGWASSTISGAHSRRYHGILVAATTPPVGRMVMLSKLDETIVTADNRYDLGANQYPGTVHPRGFEYLASFQKEIFPQFEYEAGGVRLRKTIVAPNGENTTIILYEVLDAPAEFTLELRSFMAPRDYHGLSHANDLIRREADFNDGVFAVRAYDGVPELFISVPGATFEAKPDWYRNFEYGVEQYRGLDFTEDLFTHGVFTRKLHKGDTLGVIVSLDSPSGRDGFSIAHDEEQRRRKLLDLLEGRDPFTETLALAADQFIVQRGENLRTLIAGYHWFSDWGRDTMIALPGICLVTGLQDAAKKILRTFAQSVSQGMLPNRFPDAGEMPEYNTVDATLWFFVAIYEYLRYTNDETFVRDELMEILKDIIDWHIRGTRYNIHVDTDGLLSAGETGVQLTWMDAKVGNWVVTPRQGKAVEINALWYNALMIYNELAARFGRPDRHLSPLPAERVKTEFLKTFWNDQVGGLYDYVDGDYRDDAIRPNQIFALSLPFPLIEGSRAESILRLVENRLYTPVGLRSLSPDDPAYHPQYGGDQLMRDGAYHEGTVWSWLLGPYVSALLNVRGAGARDQAKAILEAIIPHLSEACVGTISEIFDGDPPYSPRGCVAQAWSVGEILRAYVQEVLGISPEQLPMANSVTRRVHQRGQQVGVPAT